MHTHAITGQVGSYRWVELLCYCCYILCVLSYMSVSCGALRALIYPIDYDIELLSELLIEGGIDCGEIEQAAVEVVTLA